MLFCILFILKKSHAPLRFFRRHSEHARRLSRNVAGRRSARNCHLLSVASITYKKFSFKKPNRKKTEHQQVALAETPCAEFSSMCRNAAAERAPFIRSGYSGILPFEHRRRNAATLNSDTVIRDWQAFWRTPRSHSNRLSNPYQKTMFSGIIPAVD